MIKSYIVLPIRSVPLAGWYLLGVLTLSSIMFHFWRYHCVKRTQEEHTVKKYFTKNKKSILNTFLTIYLSFLFSVTILGRETIMEPFYELVPLWSWKQAALDIVEYGDYMMLGQIAVNVIMFIPVGVFLYFAKNITARRGFYVAFLFSFCIEVLQLVFRIGFFEWDDMLHNGMGSMVGVLLGSGTRKVWDSWKNKEVMKNQESDRQTR